MLCSQCFCHHWPNVEVSYRAETLIINPPIPSLGTEGLVARIFPKACRNVGGLF